MRFISALNLPVTPAPVIHIASSAPVATQAVRDTIASHAGGGRALPHAMSGSPVLTGVEA